MASFTDSKNENYIVPLYQTSDRMQKCINFFNVFFSRKIKMELLIWFVFGFVLGAISLYFYDHKQNISYALTTIKEDIDSINVKLEKFLSNVPTH